MAFMKVWPVWIFLTPKFNQIQLYAAVVLTLMCSQHLLTAVLNKLICFTMFLSGTDWCRA